jgi:hypothetical protein
LRVFGKPHTRPFWSTVWDEDRGLFVAHNEAIDIILAHTGDDPALLPEAPPVPVPPPPRLMAPPLKRSPLMAEWLGRRINGYIGHLPAGKVVGQGRGNDGYRLACWLTRDLGLTDAEALEWLEVWDSRNAVAKGTAELVRMLSSAHAYGKHPDLSARKRGH